MEPKSLLDVLTEIKQKELARAGAEALALAQCGKLDMASDWAQRLVDALRERGVVIR